MYLATKGGSSCRIPERKADYYKSMGYSLENLGAKDGEVKILRKKEDSKKNSYAGRRKSGE